MEFRKMVTITLYTRHQNRHWCIEQSFGLCERGREWDDSEEWHWIMYNIIYETSCQSRFDAQYWMLGAGELGWPRGMVQGGRRKEGSGWGTRVYLWRIHVDIWQNQYNIVKSKNKKIKIKTNKKIFYFKRDNSHSFLSGIFFWVAFFANTNIFIYVFYVLKYWRMIGFIQMIFKNFSYADFY